MIVLPTDNRKARVRHGSDVFEFTRTMPDFLPRPTANNIGINENRLALFSPVVYSSFIRVDLLSVATGGSHFCRLPSYRLPQGH